MKDAAKLIVYFLAVVLGGAILAPILYWAAAVATAHGLLPFLSRFGFESFFHRALLICALAFLWPLLRSLRLHSFRDLDLERNPHSLRDVVAGVLLAGVPLGCAAVILISAKIFLLKTAIPWTSLGAVAAAAAVVPLIEETFFRGLILGILLRGLRPVMAMFLSSAFFALVHFLKAPGRTNTVVAWHSGFKSIAHSFVQFTDPVMVLAAFTTLFLIGWILADARLRTRSLWLPIGLHGGWIFVAGVVGKMTKRESEILPWLGRNLLIGLIPLLLAFCTWGLMLLWLRYAKYANRENN
ncbi:MAG: protease family protein [Verrucomicrobiota bacterium]